MEKIRTIGDLIKVLNKVKELQMKIEHDPLMGYCPENLEDLRAAQERRDREIAKKKAELDKLLNTSLKKLLDLE